MVHVMTGLQHLHSLSIMHRDLKPANILVRRLSSGHLLLKIADFGLARVSRMSAPGGAGLSVKGTPFYMAPEVKTQDYTCNVDVYSFGVAMCEVIARAVCVPDAESVSERAEAVSAAIKHPSWKPQHLISFVSSLLSSSSHEATGQFRDFLLRCVEPDPRRRPTAADAMRDLQGMRMWQAVNRAVYSSASKLIR